jgi:hypothetical protein
MYMVGLAAMCWSIWTLRNKVTFDGHIVRNPMEPIFIMCAFVLYWAGLQARTGGAENWRAHEDGGGDDKEGLDGCWWFPSDDWRLKLVALSVGFSW